MAATRIRFNDPTGSGSGDVTAAANITDNRLVRGDGGAKGVQESAVTIDDSGNASGLGTVSMGNALTVTEHGTSPATPAAGKVVLYAKSDGLLYSKDDAGAETALGGGGGVSDGDKGDITVSASGATWTIDNDAVTYAKMQDVSATSRVLGRNSSGAGDVEEVTPAQLLAMLGILYAYKTADEAITADTTLTIDADMQVSVEANTEYSFDAYLIFASGTVEDFKFGLQVPASTTVDWNHTGDANSLVTGTESTVVVGVGSGVAANKHHHVTGAIHVAGTAGTFGITWAQNTSGGNNTTFRKGSWMRLQKKV
jgi:hypothetical protein